MIKETTFKDCVNVILKHEGGYVDDPADAGGETNFGISKRSYPDVEIRELSKEDAIHIYKSDFWDKYKIELLPEHLRLTYFDMCVNHGSRRATKILQQAHNSKSPNKLDIDGMCGELTRKAVCTLENSRLKSFRILFFADIISRKTECEKFWYGWYKRGVST